ncbi:MAG: aspartate aminotransferase family protein [Rhodothermia bacterium]|nr:aspartate aminotransferase family protein [Rhodothermia bacterium]
MDYKPTLEQIFSAIHSWKDQFGTYKAHPATEVAPETLNNAFAEYLKRLEGNYPFFHPRYAGQMLKPPHPVAQLAYFAAMFINPNNHALDGGPPTSEMEKDVIRDLARMFHFPENTLGHLTSSGTIANLEALWVARCLHPDKKIAFSEEAHYTHERMCGVLGIECVKIPATETGEIDLNALEDKLSTNNIGTVVMTAGTTGLGVIDPIHELLPLRDRYNFRVHVDAAYGGFFTLLAYEESPIIPHKALRAISECDSVVIDPHKHGLQPYGCGAVLFRDPNLARFYLHDSPYTYYTSNELHLGEISLECSRAGAAAGALWLTLKCLPLDANTGLGTILKACIRASRNFHELISLDKNWGAYTNPQLDIVTYFPYSDDTSKIDEQSQKLFEVAMNSPQEPVFLSVYRGKAKRIQQQFPNIKANNNHVRMLRSVFMKPEQETFAPMLFQRLTEFLNQLKA